MLFTGLKVFPKPEMDFINNLMELSLKLYKQQLELNEYSKDHAFMHSVGRAYMLIKIRKKIQEDKWISKDEYNVLDDEEKDRMGYDAKYYKKSKKMRYKPLRCPDNNYRQMRIYDIDDSIRLDEPDELIAPEKG